MSDAISEAVVIGGPAGAIEALSANLPNLPSHFRLPVIVVVHIPPNRQSVLAELFRAKCRLAVVEAEDKEPIKAGTVYFAPPDYHLLVETKDTLALSREEPELFSRPSIDALFESAADVYGEGLIAIVLTGANQDGSRGLLAIIQSGGVALVQDPAEAFAASMPRAAIADCPDAKIMSLQAITTYLKEV